MTAEGQGGRSTARLRLGAESGPGQAGEATEVGVEGDDLSGVLHGQRCQVRIANEIAGRSRRREQPSQNVQVANRGPDHGR